MIPPDALGRVIFLADEDRRRSWIERASCRGMDAEVFFPPMHSTADKQAAARAICAGCPVASECREYAVNNNIREGIWGGMNRRERDAYKRKRRNRELAR